MTFSIVEGRNVLLKPFTTEHLNDQVYLKWLNDKDTIRYIGRNELFGGISFPEAKSYVSEVTNDPLSYFFAVHTIENGKFIGTTKIRYLNLQQRDNQIADIGIMIGDKLQRGKGLAKDTLSAISLHAFSMLGARKLTAGVMSLNPAALNSFTSVGFKIEATLRKQLEVEGKLCDHILLGCFPEELKVR